MNATTSSGRRKWPGYVIVYAFVLLMRVGGYAQFAARCISSGALIGWCTSRDGDSRARWPQINFRMGPARDSGPV